MNRRDIFWAILAIALVLAFDHMMQVDAGNQCAHPERLGLTVQQQDAVCRQAGGTS